MSSMKNGRLIWICLLYVQMREIDNILVVYKDIIELIERWRKTIFIFFVLIFWFGVSFLNLIFLFEIWTHIKWFIKFYLIFWNDLHTDNYWICLKFKLESLSCYIKVIDDWINTLIHWLFKWACPKFIYNFNLC